ncbi:coelomocyte uptake defective protein 15-like [Ornithodoros turicata]|uniref:coelomocyte uptake defective protein 15-like n=1 Tax=Ornithodoros turicata TaxID=34597 RepID=UPI003139C901
MLTAVKNIAICTFVLLLCACHSSGSDYYGHGSIATHNFYLCEKGTCPSIDIWRNCSSILDRIYNVTSHFQRCALGSTLSSNMCETCVVQYGQAINLIHYVRNVGTDHALELCRQHFFSSGKFSVVSETFAHVIDFWKKPNCDKCFNKPVSDNSTYELSENTQKFNVLLNVTFRCMNATYTRTANASNVCVACRSAYDELNKFYDSLVRKSDDGGICFDTVAAMNRTRFLWGANQCSERHYNNLPLYITAGFFMLLAVLYYVCAFLLVNPRNTLLVQRKLFQRRRTTSSSAQNTAAKRRSTFYDNVVGNPHSINS